MKTSVKLTTIASAIAMAAILFAGTAKAQSEGYDPCPGDSQNNCQNDDSGSSPRRHRDNNQGQYEDGQAPDQQVEPNRKVRRAQDEDSGNVRRRNRESNEGQYGDSQTSDEQDEPTRRVRRAQSDWKFDSSKHRRHRHRDNEYRYEFGGFWYPEPYWESGGYGLNGGYSTDRLSCRSGRDMVSDRGFYRIRTVECEGRTYTYLGKRHGDTFRILVSSRSGRIVSVRPL